MIQCPKCSADNSDDSRFCKSCGEELSSISQAPTVAAPEGEVPPSPAISPHVGRIVSSDSVPAGGFTPGTILADRYRIIGLLGRGGMGEVYRADDLKLGQPVALKFLPPALAEDSVRRERFFAEVRITRQLSHPNICRVYDIGEVDGRHFLSMEYIDGEDLASLMKRIGHLSNEKALDIARQLVAGLSVAHERGVLHRDLKPANIMLDGHGRVRITDFGLAIAAEDESQAEEIAGTPAYMAPEQLAGKGATVRSDIYSLGLILYEIYTGKKAFKADTFAELRNQKETQVLRAPSEIRPGIDPVVERVIQRCMEKDPGSRPASVAQLAQALPGGDPLAAAIAAGETPSPEMVAASGSKEGLKPWIAWICLACILVSTAAVIVLKRQSDLIERVRIKEEPVKMVIRAQELLKSIDYADTPVDSAFGFIPNDYYFEYVKENSNSPDRFENLPALSIIFWYRQASRRLQPQDSSITPADPPLTQPGDALVMLDAHENLIYLRVVPPTVPEASETTQPFDWDILFRAAGMDREKEFTPVDWKWEFQVNGDEREAWEGTLPGHPNIDAHIEATALGGKPVLWRLTAPYPGAPPTTQPANLIFVGGFVLFPLAGGIVLARRNLRLGRGDRSGAWRLACFTFSLSAIGWVFGVHSWFELRSFLTQLPQWIFTAGMVWILYIAFEPFVRRHWPGVLVGWRRLLSGEYRNPLVGRDLLIGGMAGGLFSLLYYLITPLYIVLGYPEIEPSVGTSGFTVAPTTLSLFSGTPAIVSIIFNIILLSVMSGLFICVFLCIVRLLFRRTWAAIAAFTVIFIIVYFMTGEPWIGLMYHLIGIGIYIFIIFRFGILSLAALLIFYGILCDFPITTRTSSWYFEIGLTGLILLLAFAFYAFRTSLGGRPMFGTPRLDD